MVEAKVIEKIRRVLIDDATIKSYVSDKVYASHISSISSPEYPAISMTLLPGQARTNVPEMVNMAIQIDLWFPQDKYSVDDVLICYARIRALLHRQNLSDTGIGVKIYQMLENVIGPMIPDPFIPCHHLPTRYSVVAL